MDDLRFGEEFDVRAFSLKSRALRKEADSLMKELKESRRIYEDE